MLVFLQLFTFCKACCSTEDNCNVGDTVYDDKQIIGACPT